MAAFIPAGIAAGGSIIGGMLARGGNKETKTQKTQRHLMDELLKSLDGGGKYGALFQADEGAFNKSFRDPAMARFKNQVAPQIQQSYIASGQQRGTGMEDALMRAGVDMDQMLNEQYMQFQQGAQNRQSNAISGILGAGAGAPNQMGLGEAAGQGLTGYLSGKGFGSDMDRIMKSFDGSDQRKGFEEGSMT